MLNAPYVSLGYTFLDLVQQRRAPPPADVVAAAADDDLTAARALFERWDADGDGQLSLPEFAQGLARSPDVRFVQPRWPASQTDGAQRGGDDGVEDGSEGGLPSPRRLDLLDPEDATNGDDFDGNEADGAYYNDGGGGDSELSDEHL